MGKRRKASTQNEEIALLRLRLQHERLSRAIVDAQRFLDHIAEERITNNPFFPSLENTTNDLAAQTIPNAIRDLLNQLQRIKESLGVSKGGGSRKRRHRRRKTRRNKKKRKNKTIKRRRKRGRKTRRK